MKKFPFITIPQSLTMLRVLVSGLMMAHGAIRMAVATVGGFGEFLNSKGFVIGTAIAWFLTIFELAGGLVMAAGFFVKWIAAVFIIELIMGIILVHASNGWFVVGYQNNGVEYSVLLIFSLIVIAASAKR
ncbi:MAG TPA: DoxX family protein [Chitinophagaceae bacterium]